MRQLSTIAFSTTLALLLSGCVTTNAARLGTVGNHPPVPPEQIALYSTAAQVPNRYVEIALLNSTGDSSFTDEAQMFASMREAAGKIGANAVVLDALSEPGGGSKVAAAIFGVSAQRKGKALAIWVFPADGAAVSPESARAETALAAQVTHASRYGGDSATAALKELVKLECAGDFNLVSETDGRAIYDAFCISGIRQLMEYWMGACRQLN